MTILLWTPGSNSCHVGRTDQFNVQLWRGAMKDWRARVRPDIFETTGDWLTLNAATCAGAKREIEERIAQRLKELSVAFRPVEASP